MLVYTSGREPSSDDDWEEDLWDRLNYTMEIHEEAPLEHPIGFKLTPSDPTKVSPEETLEYILYGGLIDADPYSN